MSFFKTISLILLVGFLLSFPVYVLADDETQDSGESASDTQSIRYSAEEFDALPDELKVAVYYNSPEKLPENFKPEQYWDVFHPEQTENE